MTFSILFWRMGESRSSDFHPQYTCLTEYQDIKFVAIANNFKTFKFAFRHSGEINL